MNGLKNGGLIFLSFCFLHLAAQDDELSDLSLDELGHVKINQKSVGFLDDKSYNAANIYLGLIVPYSSEKEHSLEIKLAIDLALEEMNAAGGVLGKKISLVAADDADINELTVDYTDSLIQKYKIAALIGPTSSRRLMHLAKSYLPDHPTLVISPSASSREITHLMDNDLIWRTTPSDEFQAKLAAHYIYHNLKKTSVSILYINDVYGSGLYEEFKKNFKGKLRGEVNYSPRVDLRTFDFTEKLNTVFSDKPEAIYLIAGARDAAIITHRIAQGGYFTKNYKPILFSVDAIKEKSFIESCNKKLVEGMYGIALASNNLAMFGDKFYGKYKKYPVSPYSERAYDIAYLLALSIEKSKSVNAEDIKKELRNLTEGGKKILPQDFVEAKEALRAGQDIYFEGASGKLNFDEHGDLTTGVFAIWRIENGAYRTHEVLPFEGNR